MESHPLPPLPAGSATIFDLGCPENELKDKGAKGNAFENGSEQMKLLASERSRGQSENTSKKANSYYQARVEDDVSSEDEYIFSGLIDDIYKTCLLDSATSARHDNLLECDKQAPSSASSSTSSNRSEGVDDILAAFPRPPESHGTDITDQHTHCPVDTYNSFIAPRPLPPLPPPHQDLQLFSQEALSVNSSTPSLSLLSSSNRRRGPRPPPWGSYESLEMQRWQRCKFRDRALYRSHQRNIHNQITANSSNIGSFGHEFQSADSLCENPMKREVQMYKEQVLSMYPDMEFEENAGAGMGRCYYCCVVM